MWERQILPILQIFLLWVISGQNSVLFQAALSISALREEQGCRASRACLDKLQWMLNNCLGAARAFNLINIHCGNVRGDLRIIIIWNMLYKCLAKQSSLESQWGAHALRRCKEFSFIPCGLKQQKTSACPLASSKGWEVLQQCWKMCLNTSPDGRMILRWRPQLLNTSWAANSAQLRLVPWASCAWNAAVPGNNQKYSFWLIDKLMPLENLKVCEQGGELFSIYLSGSEVQKKLPVPVSSGFHCCEFG